MESLIKNLKSIRYEYHVKIGEDFLQCQDHKDHVEIDQEDLDKDGVSLILFLPGSKKYRAGWPI